MDIKTALKKNQEKLLQLPNVTGVGIGEKDRKDVILVFVQKKIPESELQPQDIIPKELDGYRTDVEVQIKIGK